MTRRGTIHYQMRSWVLFVQEFLKQPLQIASCIPSSRFLERRIVEAARISSANVVVELGPGTGGTTCAILRALPEDAKLLNIEINPRFHELVSSIKDDRLIPHLGNAAELKELIEHYDLDAPDAIVSGIPFSTLDPDVGSQIIEAVSSLLTYDGRFVAYQVSHQVADLCQPFLGSGECFTEYLNIPPITIFQWKKNGG